MTGLTEVVCPSLMICWRWPDYAVYRVADQTVRASLQWVGNGWRAAGCGQSRRAWGNRCDRS